MLTLSASPAQAVRASEVRVPGDKSITHRALLLGAIACGRSRIQNWLKSADCEATLAAVRACGVSCEEDGNDLLIDGVGLKGLRAPADGLDGLDFGNSGTGMRLMCGLLSGQSFDGAITLTGDASLSRRPMQRIIEPLTAMGADIRSSASNGTPPLELRAVEKLQGIDYRMPVASAQVQSCVLFAGLNADGVTCVRADTPVRDHTAGLLADFGARVEQTPDSVRVQAGELQASDVRVPGDFSSAMFLIVAATIVPGSELTLVDVGVNPTRTAALNVLTSMGADIELLNQRAHGSEPVADIRVRTADLSGVDIPVEAVANAIDEFPVLFIAAANATGTTRLRGAHELRVKESDRIAVMAEGLQACGVQVAEVDDGLDILGKGSGGVQGGRVHSGGDHRVGMAFIVAGAASTEGVVVQDCDNIATSFPQFVETMNRLQIQVAQV